MNVAANIVDEAMGKRPVKGSTEALKSGTETMKAVTWNGKKSMVVETVPKPLITHKEDAVVKVTACTICSGSDGHLYAGEIPNVKKGQIVGHEGMGIIESIGEGVTKFAVGDRVVISFDIACGKCSQCATENFTTCEMTNDSKLGEEFYGHNNVSGLFGYGELLGGYRGSQAEYVRVPFADTNLFLVPESVPDEKALYISDVVCTALHAAEMGEVKEGDTVAIWGLGPIGLCTARWCQIKGAKRIIGIDMIPERLQMAKDALGIEVVDRTGYTSMQLCEKLFEMEPKGFDVTVEAVGFRFAMSKKHKIARAIGMETDTPEIIDECLHTLKGGGIVSIIGDYAGYANMFPIGKLMFKHATVRSGQCPCQKYFSYVMDKIADGTFDPTFMITHRISLDDIPMAYEELHQKNAGWVKVFVDMKQ